eukprot:CAMPEP_0114337072 /NCGR_PEP_ID=MMETSP0101-20121206/6127_1 /TAXON_ID=38822 ORGANISM="Pteridomonas danica, Strain PT" /NCGR_SAMPLE_ID=MMETSP0101 /ASSEMBLY_ACC=CAM_ASM_000211 /LENGTH=422 /DNA_ID=CAMNT_0001469201 /DNA_START=149 /DNA_END=1417 /DNA_ORIENTATION=-
MNVQWGTTNEDNLCNTSGTVHYGLGIDSLNLSSVADCFPFSVGKYQVEQSNYVAQMTDLSPSTMYYYYVSTDDSNSEVFYFRSAPDATTILQNLPQYFLVWGDLGSSKSLPMSSSTIMPYTSTEVQQGNVDMILHVGDLAYDMSDDNGTRAQLWMNEIMNMSAYVPYMVDAGNHEQDYRFAHYTEYFRASPLNYDYPTVTSDNGEAPNNWFTSYDNGLVHIVTLSSEILFHTPALIEDQNDWLKNDLAKANENRENVPWIIVHAHRPLYCSCDGDCDGAATRMRLVFEQIVYDAGVDLFISGHEHNYERMYDVAPWFNEHRPWLSGITTQSTTNPPATIYIITGDAGNRENHETFQRDQPNRTAFRTDAYGYSRMSIYNTSHLYWEQVECDASQDPAVERQVIDSFWLVQHHHGPFNNTSSN